MDDLAPVVHETLLAAKLEFLTSLLPKLPVNCKAMPNHAPKQHQTVLVLVIDKHCKQWVVVINYTFAYYPSI